MIPRAELEASSVEVQDETGVAHKLLLHRRRVSNAQAKGTRAVLVCGECKESFGHRKPWLCKYALANDLWLGRWVPLLRNANLTHQMLLARARLVTTKVVLRPEQKNKTSSTDTASWDFLFHQSGMIGSAILFQNANCGKALSEFPSASLGRSLAVTFVAATRDASQDNARKAVSKIAKLMLDRKEFEEQARWLTQHNIVYEDVHYNGGLVASWVPDPAQPRVPEPVLDVVVALPMDEAPGRVANSGAGDATIQGSEEQNDAEVAAAKEARCIHAFEPQVEDVNPDTSGVAEVASLMQQLEDLSNAAERSVAVEIEGSLDGGAGLVDDAGRERILDICKDVRKKCEKLGRAEKQQRLQSHLAEVASRCGLTGSPDDLAAPSSGGMPLLEVPRGDKPLSLWDWQIWSMAMPALFPYGDAANLYPHRQTPLLTCEWISCLMLREELEYQVAGAVLTGDDEREQGLLLNRFRESWVVQHMFATLYFLSERQQATFAFLKNGGIKWAAKVRDLTPEAMAEAVRVSGGGSLQAVASNSNVPQLVRDALNCMQQATAQVIGTDGHRRLCRHEGQAYMTLFGAPVIFATPNLADTKQPLLLVVQGHEVRLDDSLKDDDTLPKYRDMVKRVAADPLGQTVVFELMMRLFFLHVLGVRPECLQNRRHARRRSTREWVTDGVAAASVSPGIFGLVLAFRGEIEAQGRGSLHPHILVWLLAMHLHVLLAMIRNNSDLFRSVLREWMRAVVRAVESTCQSSVRAVHRQFGNLEVVGPSVPFNTVQQNLSRFDGGDEVEDMVEELSRLSKEPSKAQQKLIDDERGQWARPSLTATRLAAKTSVYTRSLSDFSVSHCPGYRRYDELHADISSGDATVPTSSSDGRATTVKEGGPGNQLCPPLPADAWEKLFASDVEALVSQILVHMCGDSCYKYTKAKCAHICRHGFYYVIHLADDWKRRRQGKYLRNALFVVKVSDYGMQGRLLGFQEHPYECASNYPSAASMRCNLDVQDLRRVLPEEHWLDDDEELPSLGERTTWGYMQHHEWDGKQYVLRHRTSDPCKDASRWDEGMGLNDWRALLLKLVKERLTDDEQTSPDEALTALLRLSVASLSDGINTGFYINSYTTKQCPTMGGVLEELRLGLERLQLQREREAAVQEQIAVKDPASMTAEDRKVLKGKSSFGEALRTLNRLSSSYRRCSWKSGTEMLFPILFGHLTFASHRCWTVYVKKGVFMAFEQRRNIWGEALRKSAEQAGGGEMLHHLRPGMPPFPLLGWRRRAADSGTELLRGPNGETCSTTAEAMSILLASTAQDRASRKALEALCEMLTGRASAKETNYASTRHEVIAGSSAVGTSAGAQAELSERRTVFTSSYDDWMWRGDDPIVRDMSWYVYSMWIYRVELGAPSQETCSTLRYIEIKFAQHYHLHRTHTQRLATEFRVPLFEGFTMPSATHDAEAAAMYKQLLLRPLVVEAGPEPDEDRLLKAFTPMCLPAGQSEPLPSSSGLQHARAAATCFSASWQQWAARQKKHALEGRLRFLERYEWPSLWETEEVQNRLFSMWTQANADLEKQGLSDAEPVAFPDMHQAGLTSSSDTPPGAADEPIDHDSGKQRATVEQYTSIIGEEVSENLEGLARARLEKPPRAYQTDAEIHEQYTRIVHGGGDADDDGAEGDPLPEAGRLARSKAFQPLGAVSEATQKSIINFQTRTRMNSMTKRLLEMPCMQKRPGDDMAVASLRDEHKSLLQEMKAFDEWREESHARKLDVLQQQQEGRRPSQRCSSPEGAPLREAISTA